jgi:hypothetical protein
MRPSSSPAFTLRRASSLRANTRLVIVLVIGVIALAAAALFYELRHESGGKKPDKVKVKAPKEGGKKKKKHKEEGEKAPKAQGATPKKAAAPPQ